MSVNRPLGKRPLKIIVGRCDDGEIFEKLLIIVV